ncbi:hypothetical protein ASF65_11035 [Aureimonas sp. Leaf324]|jgi:hypothetical protein|nr:hypothetical protein ASF65_11035 [Aureimonas sp. Leaf324]
MHAMPRLDAAASRPVWRASPCAAPVESGRETRLAATALSSSFVLVARAIVVRADPPQRVGGDLPADGGWSAGSWPA